MCSVRAHIHAQTHRERRDCCEQAHTNRNQERQIDKGDLSVQLAFCSVESNVACLPGSPLRQERVHWDPTGPPISHTPDRGDV